MSIAMFYIAEYGFLIEAILKSKLVVAATPAFTVTLSSKLLTLVTSAAGEAPAARVGVAIGPNGL